MQSKLSKTNDIFFSRFEGERRKNQIFRTLDVSTGTADDLHSVCLIIIAVPIISAYLESGVEMIPYMTRHNASCIITKVSVILDYDAGIFFFIFLDFAVCLTSLSLLLTSFCRDYVRGGPEGALASPPPG